MRRAVIIDAVRTPIGRYGGALKSCRPDDLAALVIKTVVQRAKIDPAAIEDVYFGATNQAGEDNRNVARASQQDTQSPLVVGHGEVGDAVAIEISHHRRPGRRAAASQS